MSETIVAPSLLKYPDGFMPTGHPAFKVLNLCGKTFLAFAGGFESLRVNVLGNGTDCTNGGISGCSRSLELAMSEGSITRAIDLAPPEILLTEYDARFDRIRLIPADHVGKWVMHGGNFAYTSDSRFPFSAPIAIFDRTED